MRKVKFGVFADLHVDIMHDTQQRLEVFLDACRRENVDFIVQLGDFCYPDEGRKCICKPENTPSNVANALKYKTYADKDKIVGLYRDFEKPSYHAIGNHDCDMCTKQQILDYYQADYGPYYSFDMGGFHFVVLDPNYYMKDGQYVSYCCSNYFDESYHKVHVLPYFPDEQLEWLKKDLASTENPSVLFTHQSLCPLSTNCGGILNPGPITEVLKNAPSRVLMSLNGHEHVDNVKKAEGIYYVNINSMSNLWMGDNFVHMGRYDDPEIDEKYPNIRYVLPYSKALFAIVDMDDKGASFKGVSAEFVGVTEQDHQNPGFDKMLEKIGGSASITDKYLAF